MNIGIIGGRGFIGSHLLTRLRLNGRDQIFTADRETAGDLYRLTEFVRQCDLVIDAAGRSRGTDGEALYRENRELAGRIIAALTAAGSGATLIFLSTTHRKDLPYHRSKEADSQAFALWAAAGGNRAITLRIPNLFGPGMRPRHNSVIATFCELAAAGEEPERVEPVRLELLSIHSFCRQVEKLLRNLPEQSGEVTFEPEFFPALPEVWELLKKWSGRLKAGEFPEISGRWEFLLLEQLLRHF